MNACLAILVSAASIATSVATVYYSRRLRRAQEAYISLRERG